MSDIFELSDEKSCDNCGGPQNETFPRNPFSTSRRDGLTVLGVVLFRSEVVCPHCKSDDFYLGGSQAFSIIEELRSKFRMGEVTHEEFRIMECRQLGELLGVPEDGSVPEDVKAEVLSFLSTRQKRYQSPNVSPHVTFVDKRGALIPGLFRRVVITADFILDNWNDETGKVSFDVDVSEIIQMFDLDIPRPLTSTWRRYIELRQSISQNQNTHF